MNSAPDRGFFTGLTSMVFAIIFIGGVVGIILSNLPQQMAEADRVRAETEWEARLHEQTNLQNLQAQYEIERQRNQEIAEAARAQQAEQLRLAYLRHNQKLRVEAMLHNAGIFLLLLLGCSMAVVLTVTLSRVGWQMAGHVQASAAARPAQTEDAWKDVAWRLLRREEARLQEQKIRQARLAAPPQGMNGTGRYR
jgi:hypothetical protein